MLRCCSGRGAVRVLYFYILFFSAVVLCFGIIIKRRPSSSIGQFCYSPAHIHTHNTIHNTRPFNTIFINRSFPFRILLLFYIYILYFYFAVCSTCNEEVFPFFCVLLNISAVVGAALAFFHMINFFSFLGHRILEICIY